MTTCNHEDCPIDLIKLGQMFESVTDIRKDVKEIKEDVKKQNGRVRKLEEWRWKIVGIATALGVIGSMALKYILG